MEKKYRHYGLLLDNELHYKLYYIAEYEGRSMSGQALFLLRQYIRHFEKENGKIELDKQ